MNKLSKEELITLVAKLLNGGYTNEEELNNDLDILVANFSDPEITSYIYDIKYALAPEEIVEKALSYKPIQLPDQSIKEK